MFVCMYVCMFDFQSVHYVCACMHVYLRVHYEVCSLYSEMLCGGLVHHLVLNEKNKFSFEQTDSSKQSFAAVNMALVHLGSHTFV